MIKLKVLKILNLTTAMVLLISANGFAAGEKIETKIEKKNETSKNLKQKDDNKTKKLEIIEKNKQKKSEEKKKETAVETKKENAIKQEKNEQNTKVENEQKTQDKNKNVEKISNEDDLKTPKKEKKSAEKNQKPQKLSVEPVDVGGIKFQKVITNKEGDELYFAIYKGNLLRFVVKKKKEKLEDTGLGSINFYYGLGKDICEKGVPHFTEHNILIAIMRCLQEKRGDISTFMSPVIDKTNDINAFTYIYDGPNNIGALKILVSKKMMENEKNANIVFEELLGNPTYQKDKGFLFGREVKNKYRGKITSRALIEMYGKTNKSKYNDGTDSKIAVENWGLMDKLKYIPAGNYEKMKEVTMKDLNNFYDKYIYNGFADISYTFNSLKEAENVISLTKKCYLDKKKKANITAKGEDKLDEDYIKIKVSPEQAVEFGEFKYTVGKEGNKKFKESKYVALVKLEDDGLDIFERNCLNCLKTDYIQKLIDIKKYGFLKLTNFSIGNSLCLRVWSNEKEALKEDKIKAAVEDIKKIVIKHIEENGIDFKKDIDKEVLKNRRKILKKKDYFVSLFGEKILNSYILEKVPFSHKYFKFNKEGKMEDDPKVFEEFLKNNCEDVVKRIFSKSKKMKIGVSEKGEGEYKEEDYKESKITYLPIMYNLKKENLYKNRLIKLALFCADEVLLKYLDDRLSALGAIYVTLTQSIFLNKYGYTMNDLEIENVKNYFDSGDFKKDYDELVKKLDNKSLDKYLDGVINKSKGILDKVYENLKNNIEPYKKHIKELENLKNKKEITYEDMDKIGEKNESSSIPIEDAAVLIKLGEKEYEEYEKEKIKGREFILKTQKMLENRTRRMKKGAKKLDPKSREEYKEFLGKLIKRFKERLEKNEKYLKEIEKMRQEIQTNKLEKDDIKHIIKSVKYSKFDKNNEILNDKKNNEKEHKKNDKVLNKNDKIENKKKDNIKKKKKNKLEE